MSWMPQIYIYGQGRLHIAHILCLSWNNYCQIVSSKEKTSSWAYTFHHKRVGTSVFDTKSILTAVLCSSGESAMQVHILHHLRIVDSPQCVKFPAVYHNLLLYLEAMWWQRELCELTGTRFFTMLSMGTMAVYSRASSMALNDSSPVFNNGTCWLYYNSLIYCATRSILDTFRTALLLGPSESYLSRETGSDNTYIQLNICRNK